jgi:alpha-galactosidase
MLRLYGLFTYPSDHHIGEYLGFAHDTCGLKWPYGRECHPVSLAPEARPTPIERMAAYASGERPLDEGATATTEELTAPIISAVVRDREAWVPAVNVLNDEGFVGNLDRRAVVEVPAVADGKGVHPLTVEELPEPLAALMHTQVSIQKLLVEAYRQRSRKLLLHALLLDPVVDSIRRAEALIDDMYQLQGEFLPVLE